MPGKQHITAKLSGADCTPPACLGKETPAGLSSRKPPGSSVPGRSWETHPPPPPRARLCHPAEAKAADAVVPTAGGAGPQEDPRAPGKLKPGVGHLCWAAVKAPVVGACWSTRIHGLDSETVPPTRGLCRLERKETPFSWATPSLGRPAACILGSLGPWVPGGEDVGWSGLGASQSARPPALSNCSF